jgi:Fe-Mn family superoxide dismutase
MPQSNRRALLLGAAAAGVTAAATAWPAPRHAFAQTAAGDGPFALSPLPYAADANEPHIDAQTMQIHHGRHHAAYVSNLNAILRENPQIGHMPLEQLLARIGELPESIRAAVRNNGGGHANHTMFWEIMGGRGDGPAGELAAAISRDLGGFDKMKADFNALGGRVFGSGWVFVTVDRQGRLAIATRPNQDTPLMDRQRALIGNDVWEHAYYLKYQNRRADYLNAWWNVLNWNRVAQRYAAAKAGTLGA